MTSSTVPAPWDACPGCHAALYQKSNFCTECGQGLVPSHVQTPVPNGPHHIAARGFAQLFSVNPLIAIFVILVDAMASAVDVVTLGISVPVLWLVAGIVTGIVVFMGQKKWGGDDQEGAFIKALMISFLVILPTPFPSFLTVPSAFVGAVQMFRRKV